MNIPGPQRPQSNQPARLSLPQLHLERAKLAMTIGNDADFEALKQANNNAADDQRSKQKAQLATYDTLIAEKETALKTAEAEISPEPNAHAGIVDQVGAQSTAVDPVPAPETNVAQ